MNQTALPRIGEVLRNLITRAGYRARITERGLEKDLDDLAVENRSGAASDILSRIEKEILQAIANDAGAEWAELFAVAWHQTLKSLQGVVQNVNMSPVKTAKPEQQFNKPLPSRCWWASYSYRQRGFQARLSSRCGSRPSLPGSLGWRSNSAPRMTSY